MRRVEYGVLGPVVVCCNGSGVATGGARTRSILATLLLHANQVVSVDALLDAAFGESPPARARVQVQNRLSDLRAALRAAGAGTDVIETSATGYVIRLAPGQLDLDRFEELVARADERAGAGDLATASDALSAALALWRGPALHGLTTPVLLAAAHRLEERRLSTVERRAELDLALGRYPGVVDELSDLSRRHPYREGIHRLLILALSRSGRQADALETFREVRRVLAAQLGVEPGPALRAAHEAVLRGGDTPEPAVQEPVPRPLPRELPAATAGFTGRADELAALEKLLAGYPAEPVVAVITGTAGVGKTALAVQWAHQVADRFVDGQLYVNLGGYAPTGPVAPVEALGALLRSLGAPPGQIPLDADEASRMYRSMLSGRRVLVVLDNARSAAQVRPLLPGTAGCLVIATSRHRLGGLVATDGARPVELGVLAEDEAVALLARVLGPARVAAEAAAARALAAACAYLPLALHIAGANLIARPHHRIADYTGALRPGDRLAALAAPGDDETALRTTLDLSYRSVPPRARRLFRLLGLVPGPDVTAGAAAALADIGRETAAELLDQLAAAHLIGEPSPDRFAFHDILREYARELCRAPEAEPAAGRLLAHYLSHVDAAARLLRSEGPDGAGGSGSAPVEFTDRAGALAWLDAERPNLVAAIGYAAEHGAAELASSLLDPLRLYLDGGLYTVDWWTAATAALAAAERAGLPRIRAARHIDLATIHWRRSEHEAALAHCADALALAREAGWRDGEGAALARFASVYWLSGQLRTAMESLVDAVRINRATGRRSSEALNLGNLGLVCIQLGQLDRAHAYLTEALRLHEEGGNRHGEMAAHMNLGVADLLRGELDQAAAHATTAIALAREVGDRGHEIEALLCLAGVTRDRGQYAEALRLAYQARAIVDGTGFRRGEVDTLGVLASIHDRVGEYEVAIDEYERTLEQAQADGNRYTVAETLVGLATACGHAGRPDAAVRAAERAYALARENEYALVEKQARRLVINC